MQFHNILLYVMLAAAAITAFLGHWVDTGVLLAAVVINAIIGFIQEGKAETLGSVTVICSDKTGTLTRNEMAVQRVVCAGHVFDVGGVGYAPVGDFSIDGRRIDIHHYPALALAIRAGMLCNDAGCARKMNYGVWKAIPPRAPCSCSAAKPVSPRPPKRPHGPGSTDLSALE